MGGLQGEEHGERPQNLHCWEPCQPPLRLDPLPPGSGPALDREVRSLLGAPPTGKAWEPSGSPWGPRGCGGPQGLRKHLWSLFLSCPQTRAPDKRIQGGLPCQGPLSPPAVTAAPPAAPLPRDPCFLPLAPQALLYLPNQRLPSLIGDEDPPPQTLVVGSIGPGRAGAADGRILGRETSQNEREMPKASAPIAGKTGKCSR